MAWISSIYSVLPTGSPQPCVPIQKVYSIPAGIDIKMAEATISKTLIPGLRSLFLSSKYTDLVIRTAKKEIKVHKVVMCASSGFFARMLEGPWKETKNSTVDMKEDNADNIEEMIDFIYGKSFVPEKSPTLTDAGRIILSVEMYVLADKYDVPALKTAAKTSFETLVEEFANKDGFAAVLGKVFEIVPPTDASIRPSLANIIAENIKSLLGKKDFIDALQRAPRLQTSIITRLVNGAPAAKTFECYSCKETWKFVISSLNAHCPKCGKRLLAAGY